MLRSAMEPDNTMNSSDWQTIANMATSVAVIVAVGALIWGIRGVRQEREFQVFFRYVDAYERLETKRLDNWRKLKDAVRSIPGGEGEIGDRTNSIQYLQLRVAQQEPLYAIEHAVLELEIQSLNVLNDLCSYALKDTRKLSLCKALFATDIAFYQYWHPQCSSSELIVVRSAKTKRHFSQLTNSLHCPPTSSTTVDSVASSRPVFSV